MLRELEYTLPISANNATANPLDDHSYTPPYTSPIYHYYFPIINTILGITITPSIFSKVALLPKLGKGFLVEFGSGFRVKGWARSDFLRSRLSAAWHSTSVEAGLKLLLDVLCQAVQNGFSTSHLLTDRLATFAGIVLQCILSILQR